MNVDETTARLATHLEEAGLTSVTKVSSPLFERAAESMGRAFLEEGWTQLMASGIPDATDEERAQTVAVFERIELAEAVPKGWLWVIGDGDGVLKLELGNGAGGEAFDIVAWAKTKVPSDLLTPAQVQGLLAHLEHIKDISNFGWYAPFCPEGYIGVAELAVHPDARGKGYARTILSTLASFCDEEGLNLTLECYKPSLVELYGKFGFEVVQTLCAEGLDTQEYCMVRVPAR